MPSRVRRRSRFSFLAVPLLLCLVAAYFGWQGTRGVFGQEARAELSAERTTRQAVLDRLIAEREALEARVSALRSDRLDADLLDERARDELHMARPGEIVIFHEREDPPMLASHGR